METSQVTLSAAPAKETKKAKKADPDGLSVLFSTLVHALATPVGVTVHAEKKNGNQSGSKSAQLSAGAKAALQQKSMKQGTSHQDPKLSGSGKTVSDQKNIVQQGQTHQGSKLNLTEEKRSGQNLTQITMNLKNENAHAAGQILKEGRTTASGNRLPASEILAQGGKTHSVPADPQQTASLIKNIRADLIKLNGSVRLKAAAAGTSTSSGSSVASANQKTAVGTKKDIQVTEKGRLSLTDGTKTDKLSEPAIQANDSLASRNVLNGQTVASRQMNRVALWVAFHGDSQEKTGQSVAGQVSDQVIKWLGKSSFQLNQAETRSLTITLYPEQLGQLTVSVMQGKDGIVARMIAQTKAAKDLLESGLNQLTQDLAGRGITISQIDVSRQWQTSAGDESQSANQNQQQSSQNGRGGSDGQQNRQNHQELRYVDEEQSGHSFLEWMSGGVSES